MMDDYGRKKQDLAAAAEEAVKAGACLAFSGGTDSCVLLCALSRAARENGGKVYAVMFDNFLQPEGGRKEAARAAEECGAKLSVITVNEDDMPDIFDNPRDRCYRCKYCMFSKLIDFAKEHGCEKVLDGTNIDDTAKYRPGLKALEDLGTISPLKDAGFTKDDVRRLAAEWGLSAAKKPSDSCLATRLPYGANLDREVLRRIAEGEAYIKSLGFHSVRIRLHGDIARIEVDESELSEFVKRRESVTEKLKSLGFTYITMDLEGFRSGSMDLFK